MKSFLIRYFSFFFLGFIFFNCANQLPPGGGEVDYIPPEIIEIYPPDGTTNFNEDYFELEFSEYVDKRSLRDAIFISPALESNLKFDWSGKSVEVEFPEKLKENTTYVVTIGADLVDLNNKNRLQEAYSFSFSTGSRIDKKSISGKVSADAVTGIIMFAYNVDLHPADLYVNKPDYISQVSVNGNYTVSGLGAGTYRVFAVKDEFRDLLYQPEQDKIGFPLTDVVLKESDSSFTGLNFFLTTTDTTPPRILSSVMTDKYHLLITFSEQVDSTILSKENFFIFDSTENKRHSLSFSFKGNTKANEAVLVTTENLREENNYFIYSDTIRDKEGNIFTNDFASLVYSSRGDTTKPDIYKVVPPTGSQDIDFTGQQFSFYLNDAADTNQIKNSISFADTSGKQISFSVLFHDDASFTVTPERLEARKDYLIKVDFKKFTDAAGNRNDTVYTYRFKTITGLDFTGVSGTMVYFPEGKTVAVLEGMDNAKKVYTKTTAAGKFDFMRVMPGKYILWAFIDHDSSGTYSPGSLEPFKFAEPFSYYPDTLDLRARWTQADLPFLWKSE